MLRFSSNTQDDAFLFEQRAQEGSLGLSMIPSRGDQRKDRHCTPSYDTKHQQFGLLVIKTSSRHDSMYACPIIRDKMRRTGRIRPFLRISMYLATFLSFPVAYAFATPANRKAYVHSTLFQQQDQDIHTWSPQDLTKDTPGFLPIPNDDYVKKYQAHSELWPVEFFVIAYRRIRSKIEQNKCETQILVRKSANGTSKWGLGTGVPATRWMLSSTKKPPLGYEWPEPRLSFKASNFPEFPKNHAASWTYDKIDICEDAFNGPDVAAEFQDSELEEYARTIRNELRTKISETMREGKEMLSPWDYSRYSVVKNVLDKANSVPAIQGTLRMSGLFAKREGCVGAESDDGSLPCPRFVSVNSDAVKPAELIDSMRIYTMFPQMPDPMPMPSTSPEELQMEITSRESRMVKSGRDPHKDVYGRKFTHKSTCNVSNTIIGVYFTLDVTDLPGLDEVRAFDLFGVKEIKRQWKSLEDLKVLDSDGNQIGTDDTKPTFISGFIVRQLVKDGVINTAK